MESLRVVAEIYPVRSIPCIADRNNWNQLLFNECLGFESLISTCFECSSDTEELELQSSLCGEGLLSPLPHWWNKVVKENLPKSPAFYFQVSLFWYTGRLTLASLKQREGNKCLQEEDRCHIYEVYVRTPCR